MPKATPAYPNLSATSQAHSTFLTPRLEPSHGPFEPHRVQVRRYAITRARHIPHGEGTNPRTPRSTLLSSCSLYACTCRTPRPTPPTPSNPRPRPLNTTLHPTPHDYRQTHPALASTRSTFKLSVLLGTRPVGPGRHGKPNTRTLGCRRSPHHANLQTLAPPQRGTHVSSETQGLSPGCSAINYSKATYVAAQSQVKGGLLSLRGESRKDNRGLHSFSVENANWETEKDCRREGPAE